MLLLNKVFHIFFCKSLKNNKSHHIILKRAKHTRSRDRRHLETDISYIETITIIYSKNN